MHYYDFSNHEWKIVKQKGALPAAIDSHSAIKLDIFGDHYMVIFGGFQVGKRGDFTN
jgi:hypothetical protein